MAIKVTEVQGSNSQTTTTLDLTSHLKTTEEVKTKIKRDVGDYLLETIIARAANSQSIVKGESWAKLSKEYKAKKQAEGLPGRPTLEFEGDMLDELDYQDTPDGIQIGWTGDQAGKADGHHNFSGRSSLPKRRAIPGEGQSFIPSVEKEIESIIADHLSDAIDFQSSDFTGVSNKSQLYETLGEFFPDLSRTEIRLAIERTPKLVRFLDAEGLLDLL